MAETVNYPAHMNGEHARRELFLNHLAGCEASLRAFLAGALAIREDRADLFQEIVLILWRNFDRYDASRPFHPWALGVAVRRMKEEYRRRQRRPECLAPDNLERLASVLERQAAPAAMRDEEAALAECLNTLPLQAAQLVRWRYYEGTGIRDLEMATGQSTAALYQTLSRIRRRLAECIRQRLSLSKKQPVPANEV